MVPYCYLFFLSVFMLWFTYYLSDISIRSLTDQLFGKELFIRFTARTFRKLLSMYVFSYVFSYFPFGFEGRIWDLIVSVSDHLFTLHNREFEKSYVYGYEYL